MRVCRAVWFTSSQLSFKQLTKVFTWPTVGFCTFEGMTQASPDGDGEGEADEAEADETEDEGEGDEAEADEAEAAEADDATQKLQVAGQKCCLVKFL